MSAIRVSYASNFRVLAYPQVLSGCTATKILILCSYKSHRLTIMMHFMVREMKEHALDGNHIKTIGSKRCLTRKLRWNSCKEGTEGSSDYVMQNDRTAKRCEYLSLDT